MKRVAYLNGKFLPYQKAVIPIGTHALQYGSGCFEGIRAYWNAEKKKLYAFRLKDHFERLDRSCKTLHMKLPLTTEALVKLTVELLAKNKHRENVYIRPFVYKTSDIVSVFNLDRLENGFGIYTVPLGSILNVKEGINAVFSSWRRVDSHTVPPGAKPTGIYLNTSLAKTEAEEKGADEAILLNLDDSIAEGSAENLFIVKSGKLITPSIDQNILEGITRNTVIELAEKELNIRTAQRKVQKDELWTCDEIILTGTGMEIAPVVKIEDRAVGSGKVGPITQKLQGLYSNIVHGKDKRYLKWLTEVNCLPSPAHNC